ncbi:hypothetical protein MPTK1_8g16230 [Marchantia polymorpha subsp. ruderalis]|uniref:Uncharacterized protein n=1 Tax=Marchantia polymorpha TaxID=3197 RepID=A0A2R6W4M7_MARPO|nr:hypothetical protein MARPO_0154s0041 [Marchantia polymorpha]BBN20076.1 hypothetical protein Mp_8g16230 [Marchantia polymorpha subsp. ruderalis]|eukprot:PTQ28817.1 hypothetical protein MARPO_0154s0041 [Marchantia polymorpha]
MGHRSSSAFLLLQYFTCLHDLDQIVLLPDPFANFRVECKMYSSRKRRRGNIPSEFHGVTPLRLIRFLLLPSQIPSREFDIGESRWSRRLLVR